MVVHNIFICAHRHDCGLDFNFMKNLLLRNFHDTDSPALIRILSIESLINCAHGSFSELFCKSIISQWVTYRFHLDFRVKTEFLRFAYWTGHYSSTHFKEFNPSFRVHWWSGSLPAGFLWWARYWCCFYWKVSSFQEWVPLSRKDYLGRLQDAFCVQNSMAWVRDAFVLADIDRLRIDELKDWIGKVFLGADLSREMRWFDGLAVIDVHLHVIACSPLLWNSL